MFIGPRSPAERRSRRLPRLEGAERGVVRCQGEGCSAIPGGCPSREAAGHRRASLHPTLPIADLRIRGGGHPEASQFPVCRTARISAGSPLACRERQPAPDFAALAKATLQNRSRNLPFTFFRVRDTDTHLSSSSGRTSSRSGPQLAVRSPVQEGKKPKVTRSRWIIGSPGERKGWGFSRHGGSSASRRRISHSFYRLTNRTGCERPIAE